MSTSGLPVRKVSFERDAQPFWDATTEGRLVLPRCNGCAAVIWYPRGYCPTCQSMDITWFEASGRATVYSFSITRKGSGAWAAVGPYVTAYVELDEGPRVLSNIVGCAVEDVRIGMAVRVVFDDTGEGAAVPRFTPS
jgi:uncharacterized protein